MEIADLNGDDRPDIVTADVSAVRRSARTITALSVLLNDGNGGFGTRHDFRTSGTDGVAIRDLNGDGKPDLVAHASEFSWADVVSVFLNQGDGSFGAKHNYSVIGGHLPTSLLGLVDLNGDGRPDLVSDSWEVEGPQEGFGFVVSLNHGDGTFGPRRFYSTGWREMWSATLADLDGDGKPDLVVAPDFYPRGAAGVFFNRGDGRFRPRLDYPTRGRLAVDVADLNGDGKPDVVMSDDRPPSVVSVLLNTPGLCNVQDVWGRFRLARQKLARAGCRVGRVRYVHERYGKGYVISQRPKFGAVRPRGARVNLVVNLGLRR
jgi:hypothetical protein